MSTTVLPILLLASVIATSSGQAPLCCRLSHRCIFGQTAVTGASSYIGASLNARARNQCNRGSQRSWCVARYSDGNWYCSSPGNFVRYLSGYIPSCPGRIFPTSGRKARCGVAVGRLPAVRVPRPAQRCCELSPRCMFGLQSETGDYQMKPVLSMTDRYLCHYNGGPNHCVARWTDGSWYCTAAGSFVQYLSEYGGSCRGGAYPASRRARCPVAESSLAQFSMPRPAPYCCRLARRCTFGRSGITGEYKIGSALTKSDRAVCSVKGGRTWCVSRYSDGLWYCTSPGYFSRYIAGYRQRCPRNRYPPSGGGSSRCPSST